MKNGVGSGSSMLEEVEDENSDLRGLAQGPNGIHSMYMPIKALNTFSRDWKI